MHIGTPSARRSRCQWMTGVALGDVQRAGHAGAGLLAAGQQGLRLGEHAAALHLLGERRSAGCAVRRGRATKVPAPGIRSSSPSTTRASIAWRTVIRATPKLVHELALGGRRGARGRAGHEGAHVLAHLDVLERAARRSPAHRPRQRDLGRRRRLPVWRDPLADGGPPGPRTVPTHRHSVAIARSTSSRAARRAGKTAASTPMTSGQHQEDDQLTDGMRSPRAPGRAARTSARRRSTIPSTTPSTAPSTAITTDSRRIISRSWPRLDPDRAEQPDLAGPLDHRQGERVDDAEHRDHQREPEQRVDHQHQPVDRGRAARRRTPARPSPSRPAAARRPASSRPWSPVGARRR